MINLTYGSFDLVSRVLSRKMDPAANKKRRYQKNNHNENYHPRYRKHSRDWNWRSDSDNFRDGNRYHNTNRPPGGGSHEGGRQQFTDSNPFSCDIQIHLIGRKMKDPMIHVCETCSLPIRSYGRMIPCKHVFCFSCAKKTDNNCPRLVITKHNIKNVSLNLYDVAATSLAIIHQLFSLLFCAP
uniref:ZF(RING/C2H2)-1 zinc finger protein n=1 Tax=Phallusia mammillata TaxID=59560 RepID=A0A6F9D8Y7_9ASCI|nr:ZF(RING/C2H2)-1 zinc finger protein [Phallusia mammillata]